MRCVRHSIFTTLYPILLLAAFSVLWSLRAEGQAVTATLVGTITDPSGAVVSNAHVTITNQGTGIAHAGATNGSGNYQFTFLQPGEYSVSAAAPGFQSLNRRDVDVVVNTTTRVDLTLQLGSSNSTVTVTSQAPILQTDRADVNATIGARQIQNLPGSERNFQTLTMLVPGVTTPSTTQSAFDNAQGSESFNVNGQSELVNNTMIDGINDNLLNGQLQVYIPPAAAIQTVSVETSNYAPEFGRAGGAVTNVILKSGTNHFHGSAYEFNKVSALAARSYFTSSGPFPRSTVNYYGATLGGPIIKRHTFFFADYAEYGDYSSQHQLLSVPTAAFRIGDLSAGPTAIYNPQTGNPNGTGRQQFDYQGKRNVIPPNMLDPIAQKLLALVPLPNIPGAGFTNNYQKNTLFNTDTKTFDVTVDQRIAGKDLFTGRYSWQRTNTYQQPVFGDAGGPAASAFEGTGVNRVYDTALEYTHIISPTLFTELRGGISHYRNTAQQSDYGTDASTQIGIPGVNIAPFYSGLSSISIGGYSSPMVGYSASIPWIRAESHIELDNNWTKILGNHSIVFGFQFQRVRHDLTQGQTHGPRGAFTYSDGQTALNTPGSKTSFANDFASFLLDVPSSVGRDVDVNSAAWRQSYYAAFAQDAWEATRKLTLTYGLRWEFFPPAISGRKGGFSQYDPATNTLHVSGYGNVPNNLGANVNWKDFDPRVGFAYRVMGGTVVRGGFGVSHMTFPNTNVYAYNYPVRQNNTFNSLSSYTPAVLPNGDPATLEAGFPTPILAQIPSDGILPVTNNNEVYYTVNTNYRDPYIMFYNLTIQQNIGAGWTATISYVGNEGRHIYIVYNLNAGQIAGAGAKGQPYYQLYGNSSAVYEMPAGRNSDYNALQARLTHRFHHGLEFTSAFAWQKAMGYSSNVESTDGPDFYLDPRRDYSPLDWNMAVTSTNSFIYQLPFGAGKDFLSQGWAGRIAGGWQISGIASLYTGTPLLFTASGSQLNAPGTTQVPDETAPFHKLYGIGTSKLWFDTSAFKQPVGSVLGNMGKNVYSGPGSVTFDASAFRTFPVGRRVNLQFRADAFNVLNHPAFNNPNTSLTSASFGEVTGSSNGRSMQLSAKVNF